MTTNELRIYCDGGARGNPGPAAVGVVIEEGSDGAFTEIVAFGTRIGEATNNTAEYSSVLAAFNYLKKQGIHSKKITVFMDSQVVSRQLAGLYKINKTHLKQLHTQVKLLESEVGETIIYNSIAREQNSRADLLLNKALDLAI